MSDAIKTTDATDLYTHISEAALLCGMTLSQDELAHLAAHSDMGRTELKAIESVFGYLADKRRDQAIATSLKLSRLPQRSPKTFQNFDFGHLQGKGVDALRNLSALSHLYARKNLTFIGPGGIGKTHLAQAYGYECCLNGFKAYYLKATELRDKLAKAAETGSISRAVATLVKPSCLIIDEVGRCTFDRVCTDIFFDVIDRRYEKEAPNTLILTSNISANKWGEFFTGDETLLCTLDRIFDRATVFMMKGVSFRGAQSETLCVESSPIATKLHK